MISRLLRVALKVAIGAWFPVAACAVMALLVLVEVVPSETVSVTV